MTRPYSKGITNNANAVEIASPATLSRGNPDKTKEALALAFYQRGHANGMRSMAMRNAAYTLSNGRNRNTPIGPF
jgi:hypothetical protein